MRHRDSRKARAPGERAGRPGEGDVGQAALLAEEAEDAEERAAPPLHGKTHPPAEMDSAMPTLDDEVRRYHHHPNDAGTTAFGFDPDAADAAADLAGELGSTFLTGATFGEDMSDVAMSADDREESELPLVLGEDDDLEELDLPR